MAVGELRCLRPRLLLVQPFYVSRAIASGLLLLKAHPSQAHTNEEAPTDERSGARLAKPFGAAVRLGIAGSMVPFSAKRKGRQSFAPRFVYPPKVRIEQMRGKLLSTSRVRATGGPQSGSAQARRRGGAYANRATLGVKAELAV
jgi:hypothetical protein